ADDDASERARHAHGLQGAALMLSGGVEEGPAKLPQRAFGKPRRIGQIEPARERVWILEAAAAKPGERAARLQGGVLHVDEKALEHALGAVERADLVTRRIVPLREHLGEALFRGLLAP